MSLQVSVWSRDIHLSGALALDCSVTGSWNHWISKSPYYKCLVFYSSVTTLAIIP